MKTRTISILASVLLLCACGEGMDEQFPVMVYNSGIRLEGSAVDTAYLYGTYKDPGAVMSSDKDKNGLKNCNEQYLVSDVTGSVNTRIAGTYFLTYHAVDSAGMPLPAVTRTVHVVENKAAFLSGSYRVSCTCTAVTRGSATPTISTEEYNSVVTIGSADNRFDIMPMSVGPGKLVSDAHLEGTMITAGFWSSDYVSISASGTLAASKNSFTLESKSYPYNPNAVFTCRNVYTKQLIVQAREEKK